MDMDDINSTMEQYIANQEIPGASLIVRKDGRIIYQNKWGFANVEGQKPIEFDSVFRIMSMTKCVIAIGIMKLVEQGKLKLDDALSQYIPSFRNMRVSDDKLYQFRDGMKITDILPKLLFFKMNKVKSVPAQREITIRDLLSHSSGLEQGIVGLLAMMKDKKPRESLAQQADKYAGYVLDFQPGTAASYSPIAGFDMLTRIIEIVTGRNADVYLQNEIFKPLEMTSTFFWPDSEQKKRIVSVYKRKKGVLINVTGTKEDIDGVIRRRNGYISGSGGLYSTLLDYERFAWMLCNEGDYNGRQFLKSETVALIHTQAQSQHIESEPGFVWGLGVKIRQNPVKGGSFATEGTYGWSGAFGTHFFVSPKDHLGAVFMVNRSDLNGAGSYISNKVEEMIFGLFSKK